MTSVAVDGNDTSSRPDSVIDITWPQLPQRSIWVNSDTNIVDIGENPNKQSKTKQTSTDPVTTTAAAASSYSITPIQNEKAPKEQPGGCEYLDHTADVQLHVWASSRAEAFAASVVGLHSYMIDAPDVQPTHTGLFEATGHDEHSLLFAILDEALFMFASESFVITRATVDLIQSNDQQESKNNGSDNLAVRVWVWGYYFQQGVHQQGTEVKAITYSNMQVVDNTRDNNSPTNDGFHLYVIVDI